MSPSLKTSILAGVFGLLCFLAGVAYMQTQLDKHLPTGHLRCLGHQGLLMADFDVFGQMRGYLCLDGTRQK